jgi:hypothetical protein
MIKKTFIYDNGVVFTFEPSEDPEFFKEAFETKYKQGDKVYLTD